MIGSYRMMDWEREHLTRTIGVAIQSLRDGTRKEIDMTGSDICPANVSTIMTEHLGFEEEDIDENFCDFWFIFHHPNDPDNLYFYLQVDVQTFEMKLFMEVND